MQTSINLFYVRDSIHIKNNCLLTFLRILATLASNHITTRLIHCIRDTRRMCWCRCFRVDGGCSGCYMERIALYKSHLSMCFNVFEHKSIIADYPFLDQLPVSPIEPKCAAKFKFSMKNNFYAWMSSQRVSSTPLNITDICGLIKRITRNPILTHQPNFHSAQLSDFWEFQQRTGGVHIRKVTNKQNEGINQMN